MLVQLPAAVWEINKTVGWNKDGTRQRAVEIEVRNKLECMFPNMFIGRLNLKLCAWDSRSVNEVGGKLTSWWQFRWRRCGRLSIQQKFWFESSEIPRSPLKCAYHYLGHVN